MRRCDCDSAERAKASAGLDSAWAPIVCGLLSPRTMIVSESRRGRTCRCASSTDGLCTCFRTLALRRLVSPPAGRAGCGGTTVPPPASQALTAAASDSTDQRRQFPGGWNCQPISIAEVPDAGGVERWPSSVNPNPTTNKPMARLQPRRIVELSATPDASISSMIHEPAHAQWQPIGSSRRYSVARRRAAVSLFRRS